MDTLPPDHSLQTEVRYVSELSRELGPDTSHAGELVVAMRKNAGRFTVAGGIVGAYGVAGGGEESGWADARGPIDTPTHHWSVGGELQGLFFPARWADFRVATGVRYRNWVHSSRTARALEFPIDLGVDFAIVRDTVWIGALARLSLFTSPSGPNGHSAPGPESNVDVALGLQLGVRLP
jgi:hypothetical protein